MEGIDERLRLVARLGSPENDQPELRRERLENADRERRRQLHEAFTAAHDARVDGLRARNAAERRRRAEANREKEERVRDRLRDQRTAELLEQQALAKRVRNKAVCAQRRLAAADAERLRAKRAGDAERYARTVERWRDDRVPNDGVATCSRVDNSGPAADGDDGLEATAEADAAAGLTGGLVATVDEVDVECSADSDQSVSPNCRSALSGKRTLSYNVCCLNCAPRTLCTVKINC